MTVDPRVLAQIAAAAYRNVSDENRILAPVGWTQIATYPASGPSDDPVSGFSAVAFRGPGGEVVISYAGTNVASKLDNDWIKANAPAALGMYSPQVAQAGEFYWQVLNRPDVGLANKGRITFTGHSLGGGLASLMATYFDLPATTFDSAPFELSAFVGAALDQYAGKFAAAGITDAGWQQYRAAQATASLPQLFAQREARVSHIFVTNEALEPWRFQYNAIVGSERPLDSGAAVDHATRTQLHSMQLAWAMLASQDFAAEVRKLPRLVALIDDERLFGRDRTTRSQDFLSLLLKSEQATGMLTQFTGDLKDISGKFPAASATVSDALLALTMAHYYRMSNGFDAQVGEAVRSIEGGLELAIGGAGWNGRGFARAYELLRDMVDLLSGGGADAARSWQKDRLVIADGTALSFLDAAGKGDLVLGGTVADSIALGDGDDYASGLGGVDILDGGAGDDVLDGGAGADTLDGGPGNDTLIGGIGADVYRFGGAFGHDVIEDSGGDGQIRIDDAPLPQGLRVPGRDNVWASADGAFTYVLAPSIAGGSSGTLYVQKAGAGTITIGNYAPGQLGIDLSDAPAPPTDYTIVAVADNPAIMLGDRVLATGGADRVLGTAQHDAIVGLEGDDLIEAGEGGDVVLGGFGADRIHGGGGNDAIRGGGYRDDGNYFNVYTSSFGTTPVEWINVPYGGGEGAAAYVALPVGGGLAWAGIGFGGLTAYSGNLDQDGADLIDAGAGDDLVYADGGNDLILAGSGGDRAHAGAGDDRILGEGGDDELRGDYVPPGRVPQPGGMEDQGADVIDGGDGSDRIWGAGRDDALYGGAGNDRLWGDDEVADLDPAYHGNDLLDGGSGNDQLIGQGADDTLHGGSDDDLLVGDDTAARLPGEQHGDDRLDGEAGSDELQGQGGADVLYGGSGNDTLFGDDLTAVLAGRFHGADHLDGEDGDDYLEGQGGADELFGGDGVDTLYGDAVATHVDPAFHGDDLLDGEGGNDLLIGGGGEDMLFGGGGNDRLLGDDVQSMLPAAAHADDYLDGEDGDDMLAGLGGADLLVGGEGNDTLMGDGIATEVAVTAHGDDVLDGGDGADTLLGGGGNDTVIGGSGNDRLDGDDVAGNVDGSGHGDDLLDGGAGDDVLHGGGRDDALFGGDGADYLHGDDSPGSLGIAFHGNDVLDGGAGADNLVGGAGDDHLTGGSGSDVLRGGDHDEAVPSGSDTFHFDLGSGYDWIVDRDPTAGSSDALVFGAAVQRSSLAMGRSGADLVIVLPFTLDRVVVRDYFLAASSEPVPGPGLIEALKFADGASWSFADVTAFIAGGGGYAGTYGFDTLSSLDDRANDANFNAYDDKSTAGDDTIDARGGDDAIRGREGNDWLIGGAGNDVLDGGPGSDALEGGTGDDLLNAGSGDDLFIFRPGDGSDTINPYKPSGQADVDTLRFGAGIAPGDLYMYRLGQSLVIRIGDGADRVVVQDHYGELGGLNRIEFADGTAWGAPEFEPRVLRVTPYDDEVVGSEQADAFDGGLGDDLLYGHGGDDLLAGGAGDDMLYGDDGNDTLDGGEGADVLRGGPGNDVYFVDRAEDDPSEVSNAGVDEIRSSVSLALPGGFENLVLLGSSAIDGTGNELNNRLTGNDGVNVLTGGPGNDTYVVQNTDDRVVEAAAQGTDTVQASVSFLLPANVENLTLAGTAAIDGTGNASNNTIQGNGAANVLDGGAGGDALRGGGGDDVYVVDSASDVVTENANEGFDTVRASVSFTLANNIEKLELTGAAAISGTGNSLANVLAGNGASNVLTGGAGNDLLDGGAGSDTMRGGTGDDTYVVNAGTDVVTENANEGADTVQSSVTLTLAANVEHLQLTGAAAINGTGNSLANHLRGNSAANTLNGSGSNDVLQGAGGNDTVTDTSGNNVLDGGDGADGLNGGTGREFIAGGTGNDTLKLGGGADIVAFNRGHGADSVTAPTSGSGLGETNDTLTLGGVRYADLRLARSGGDLLIKLAGTSDSVKLTGWYSASGNRTVTTLQVIVDSTADYNAGSADPLVNRRVVRLNFTSLVNAFNAAYAANPSIGDWAVPGGTLSSAFVAGSDTQAIGGALAYHYGRDGNLSALDFAAASAVLGAASFATAAQAFATSPTTGGVRLMSAAPVVEEPAPTVSRLAVASLSGAAESLPREGEVPVSPVEAVRSPSRVQALAESWAVALADSADSGSNRYLTPGSWLPGAGIADVEVTTSASGPATEGIEAGRSWLLEDGTVGGNDAALAAAVVKRWSAIDEAMLGLDVQGDRLLGGTAMEVCGSFEERLGLTPLAMGAEVQATRPRWPVATH